MSDPSYEIRPVRPDDVPAVVTMVHDLAAFERAAESCHLTDDQLHEALFASRPALFGHVVVDTATDEPFGFALWFLNYSTWEGTHGVYIEDLYVRPQARGGGAGRALLEHLAALCVERGYRRLQWWVLDWNEAAIGFYRRLGAIAMDEWTVYRVSGDALKVLAGEGAA